MLSGPCDIRELWLSSSLFLSFCKRLAYSEQLSRVLGWVVENVKSGHPTAFDKALVSTLLLLASFCCPGLGSVDLTVE